MSRQRPPVSWASRTRRASLTARVGFSFALNFRFNFQVPRAYLLTTFRRFAAVSCLSFLLNLAVMAMVKSSLTEGYAPARLLSAGVLFMIAYTLHRRYTFRLARDFGVAVYATKAERVGRIYRKIGWNCDHVHVDLVDETMNPAPEGETAEPSATLPREREAADPLLRKDEEAGV